MLKCRAVPGNRIFPASDNPMLECLAFDFHHDQSGANVPPPRWSVGSALFLASFAAVMGPMNYLYHLCSAPRLPFTTAYFGSILMTLIFALKVGLFSIFSPSSSISPHVKRHVMCLLSDSEAVSADHYLSSHSSTVLF